MSVRTRGRVLAVSSAGLLGAVAAGAVLFGLLATGALIVAWPVGGKFVWLTLGFAVLSFVIAIGFVVIVQWMASEETSAE